MPHTPASEDDSDYCNNKNVRKRRRRSTTRKNHQEKCSFVFPLDLLSETLAEENSEEENCFEDVIEPLLDDLLSARKEYERNFIEVDASGHRIRPLRFYEIVSSTMELNALPSQTLTTSQALLRRKLKLDTQRQRGHVNRATGQTSISPMDDQSKTSGNSDVLDALYSIKTTPFASSFLSRLRGTDHHLPPGLIAADWETRTPWMDLMVDIRNHYHFAHSDRYQPNEHAAPVTYSTLHAIHLPQVHDLLERSFWPGIDVSDSLDYQPEKATMLAMYKKIVVGVTILKSPQEPYIMYLAVKAGWDKSQIARTMLYHLITMNPHKDITLHVSTNSSAMLLYNQFGFKVEEFVAGFYSKYLDPQSRLSNNAFKLRLRHLQS